MATAHLRHDEGANRAIAEFMNAIQPIPELPPALREAAIKGTLIPFVGAGASVMAGCPNWSSFADAALRHFVELGKFSHGQLAQLIHQHPRVKLSIALGLERKHNIPIDYEKILYSTGKIALKPFGQAWYSPFSGKVETRELDVLKFT